MSGTEPEEFDLAALVHLLWRYRHLVASVSLAFALLTGLFAFTAKPLFRAEVVVTEARDRGMGGASTLASQLGGLATLAGMNLPTGNLGGGQTAAAVLESHLLAEEFIKRNNLLPVLQRGSAEPKSMWLAVDQFK
ncbi:MAG: hypothetical protein JO299_16175, partial [Gammaproteobacteria bacterium]|nr:hypothetical protein [Gammaproteobacteria bacterium]